MELCNSIAKLPSLQVFILDVENVTLNPHNAIPILSDGKSKRELRSLCLDSASSVEQHLLGIQGFVHLRHLKLGSTGPFTLVAMKSLAVFIQNSVTLEFIEL